MHADKSWQGDQSSLRPDQNHTPDTVVVYPDRLTKCGETDFRHYQEAPLFKIISITHCVLFLCTTVCLSNQMYLHVQNMKQLKTRMILCFFSTPNFVAFSSSCCMSALCFWKKNRTIWLLFPCQSFPKIVFTPQQEGLKVGSISFLTNRFL